MELFWDGSTDLGECPTWDVGAEALYWIDIEGNSIHRQDLAGNHEVRILEGRPGSIALTHYEDVLLVAVEHQLVWLHWPSASVSAWLDLEPQRVSVEGNRLNDGRVDRSGSFWVGSMFDPTSRRETTGMLHRVDPDGANEIFRSDIGVSNGLAFSPDGSTMYFADSPRRTVWAYDYIAGVPVNERVFVELGELDGFPDGATVDAEGCYWMAGIHAGVLYRFTPDGQLDQTVTLPVREPTMCAFGGPDLRTLFVTSFGTSRTKGDGPAGSILALDVGVAGLPEPRFLGKP